MHWATSPTSLTTQAPARLPPPCRPYLLTALLFCCVSLPLGLMKLVALVRHSQLARRQWPPFVALFALHMAFAVLQVLAAQVGAKGSGLRGAGGCALCFRSACPRSIIAGSVHVRAAGPMHDRARGLAAHGPQGGGPSRH